MRLIFVPLHTVRKFFHTKIYCTKIFEHENFPNYGTCVMYMWEVTYISLLFCSLHCQHQKVSELTCVVYVCMFDRRQPVSLHVSNISKWVLLNDLLLCMCKYLNSFFIVYSLHYQHQKVSFYWKGTCYVCLDVWPEATYFSPCLFSPLPTSASEFYW